MRTFTPLANPHALRLLDVLADGASTTNEYRGAMTALGRSLGIAITGEFPKIAERGVYVVCTVEDADFLARGVLEGFSETGVPSAQIRIACFWNERLRNFTSESRETFDVAPITKQYREPADVRSSLIVMVKSIISGACVVKTNLAALIRAADPSDVIVAAPVMVKGSPEKLASEFARRIADRFRYITFALDDPAGDDHIVHPGIGGSVYHRLGMPDKASYIPDLVRQRRLEMSA